MSNKMSNVKRRIKRFDIGHWSLGIDLKFVIRHLKLLPIIGLWFLVFNIANGQYYFEKNKVQYQDFRFKTLPTEHFVIYFYDGGENLADYASQYCEQFFAKLTTDLQMEIKTKIPVIIYNSPNEFGQTNIVLDIIEESVGGFSELFKNRVVLPFNGSYKEFRHVIEHEITHIFEFEMFYRSKLSSLLTLVSEFSVPLYVMEGFSEFISKENETDIGHEIFMRDFILNHRFIGLDQISDEMGYLNYRIGEEFFRYVAATYDRKKAFEFLHILKSKRNIEATFKSSFGMSVIDFSKKFEDYLKIKYWPEITKKDNFTKVGRTITDHTKDASLYNTAPAISPTGTKIAFVSDRNGYADIYVISAIDGRVLKHLVKGERSSGFESMNVLEASIGWSSDEKFVVFDAKSHGKDNIVIVNYPSGKLKKRLSYQLDGIRAVTLSPDNRRVCFVGIKNGYADIYVAEIGNGKLTRITYDYYEDCDPVFSSDGKTIIFVSDRPDFGEWQPGAYSLYQVAYDTENTNNNAMHIENFASIPRGQYLAKPKVTSDGKHLIFSAADSSYNIFIYSLVDKKIVQKTDFAGGAYYPSVPNDNDKLAFSYYTNMGWDIAVIDEPFSSIPAVQESLPQEKREPILFAKADWLTYEPTGIDQSKVNPYQFSLTPDYAVGQASYGLGEGIAGQLNIALSDALGNHRFYLVTDLYQDISNSEILFNYWYLPKRTDWALVLFQNFEYPAVYSNYIHIRRNRGLGVLGSYPFDKFTRFEFGTIGYWSYNEIFYKYPDNIWRYWVAPYNEQIVLADQAFVFDNTIWNDWGPVKGTRLRFESYQTIPFSSRKFYSTYLDFRNYLKISSRYHFATWLFGGGSFGPDPEQYAMGSEYVRGYEYQEFYDNPASKLAFASFELRHPFIDQLKIAFPIPITLSNIRGVTFFDAGMVFNDSTVIYQHGNGFQDLKMGVGAGIRMQISYFLLKLDFAKPLSMTENKNWKVYFSLGTDF